MRMQLNIDAGEGEVGSVRDLELMEVADALNLALGGHAGEVGWTRELAARCEEIGCAVHLHPGYPDRENFGRVEKVMEWTALADSLSAQREVLPEVVVCKFHGALYSRAAVDEEMAGFLVEWCGGEEIDAVLAPPGSAMEVAARKGGLGVMREGFADRRYVMGLRGLELASRAVTGAVLNQVDQVRAQVRGVVERGIVVLTNGEEAALQCETLCVHGDGARALEIAKEVKRWLV